MSASPRGRIVLVTGTDTGVGKTWIACGLVRALRAGGHTVAVRKPAETGCAPAPSAAARGIAAGDRRPGAAVLYPADAAALREAADSDEPLEKICAVRLAEPLAPSVAARRAGIEIDVAGLVRSYRERAREVDVLVVEGAGGLLVPLHGRTSYADLAGDLGAGLIVVVGARLGAINHALLTLEAARVRGLRVLGVVVNHFGPDRDLATETLGETLRSIAGVPILAEVPHRGDAGSLLPIASLVAG